MSSRVDVPLTDTHKKMLVAMQAGPAPLEDVMDRRAMRDYVVLVREEIVEDQTSDGRRRIHKIGYYALNALGRNCAEKWEKQL